MAHITAVPIAASYSCWSAVLGRRRRRCRRWRPRSRPWSGVLAAAIALGEPFGVRQILALALTLGGVTLAIRQRV
jgi:probable blue pigment (indigoidine) exporter